MKSPVAEFTSLDLTCHYVYGTVHFKWIPENDYRKQQFFIQDIEVHEDTFTRVKDEVQPGATQKHRFKNLPNLDRVTMLLDRLEEVGLSFVQVIVLDGDYPFKVIFKATNDEFDKVTSYLSAIGL